MKASKRIIALCLSFSIMLTSALPVFAAGNVSDTGHPLFDLWNEITYITLDYTTGLGGLYTNFVDWCGTGFGNPSFKYEIGGGAGRAPSSGAQNETVYNSTNTTNNYQAIDVNNNTYYNPVVGDQVVYESITWNESHDVYNITNNQYTTYIANNFTYLSYFVIDNDTESTWYYEIYYQLPDGRNSWNMTKEEVWGLGLSYDPVNYDFVAEDSATLGLWHFDGNLQDASVYDRDIYWSVWSEVAYDFIDSPFASGLKLDGAFKHYLQSPTINATGDWTLEGRLKFNIGEDFLPDPIQWTEEYSGSEMIYPENPFVNGSVSAGTNASNFNINNTSVYTGAKLGSLMILYEGGTQRFFLPVTADVTVYTRGTSVQKSSGYYEVSYNCYATYKNLRCCGIPVDSWFTYAIVNNSSGCQVYVNGRKYGSSTASMDLSHIMLENDGNNNYPSDTDRTGTTVDIKHAANFDVVWDELRVTNRALYTWDYMPSAQPFDTNKVYVLPETGKENQIAVKSSVPVSLMRVGGVRPTYPTDGYLYVYLENGTVMDVQQYQTDGWYSVDAAIYKDGEWHNLRGRDLTDISIEKPEDLPDDTDPEDPGDSGGSGSGSGGGSSATDNTVSKVLDTILAGALELIGNILGLLLKVVFGLLGWATKFLGFINSDYLGGFFPAPIWAVVCVIVPLIVVLGLIRFIRGFL